MTDYTIFYTDDDEDDITIFTDAVDSISQNIILQTYSEGQKLLNAIFNPPSTPYVVFLDLNMPGKNGFDVLEELRNSDYKKDIPVVIYSTSSEPGIIEKCRTLGANGFITKPVLMSDIIKSIEHAIQIDWGKFITTKSNFVLNTNI
ncbi:response regulator [Flavobacterium sp. 17A]|uniref:Response regulator n=1 Tax=Flavobacterium potami TaxID=2872310 RepID=A0A9X1HA87_9FLAO|nr:response regulator [Flavobacterium potami]MBZ4034948.1 response regulator [Flavobacterium potami]